MDTIDPNNPQKQYKGIWLPKEILDNPDLTPTEKILLAIIESLDDEQAGGCYASNEYLSSKIDSTAKSTSNRITSLKEKGYIIQTKYDGRHRFIRSALSQKWNQSPQIVESGSTNCGVSKQGSEQGSDNIVNRKELLEEKEGGSGLEADKEKMKPTVLYQRVKSIFRQRKDVDKKTCLEGIESLQERLDDETIIELATYCASDKFKPIIREDGSSWKPNFFWFTSPDKTESVVNTFKGTPSLYQEKRRLKY